MKRIVLVAVCAAILMGCGDKGGTTIAELESKNNDLTRRVESLEKQLLDAQKQLIAQQQAMQTIHTRQREMENYFNKLQVVR